MASLNNTIEDGIAEVIQALENKRRHLLCEVEDINLELQNQKAKLARLLNDRIWIHKLPDEILASIVTTIQHYSSHIGVTVALSHVSTRWRDVVLSTPLLWNEIVLQVRPSNHTRGTSITRLQDHLKRSNRCYLDIVLTIFVDDSNPYLKLICAHSDRWRRVSILLKNSQITDVCKQFLVIDTPILEHLSLHIGSPGDAPSFPRVGYTTVAPQILQRGAPNLTFVRLAGQALGNLHAIYTNVSTMHLDGWTRHYLTWFQFKTILDSVPLLENLSLNQLCIRHRRDPLDFPIPSVLHNLRRLRIRGHSTPISRFFSLMEMPKIDSLYLQQLETFATDSDTLQMPSLKSLSLESCVFDEPQIQNLWNTFPALESLSVDDSVPTLYHMLYLHQDDPGDAEIPWPHLRILAIRDLPLPDIPHFVRMIFSRSEQRKPLQRVLLDRRSRTNLRSKLRLDWLSEKAAVENCDSLEPWPPGLGYDDPHDLEE